MVETPYGTFTDLDLDIGFHFEPKDPGEKTPGSVRPVFIKKPIKMLLIRLEHEIFTYLK